MNRFVQQSTVIKYIAILLLVFSGSAFADTERFKCVVTYLHTVVSDRTIVDDTDYLKNQIGSTFYVDRKSGVIRGGYFISYEHSDTISVTNEPTNNSYYVVSISHGPIRTESWHDIPYAKCLESSERVRNWHQ